MKTFWFESEEFPIFGSKAHSATHFFVFANQRKETKNAKNKYTKKEDKNKQKYF